MANDEMLNEFLAMDTASLMVVLSALRQEFRRRGLNPPTSNTAPPSSPAQNAFENETRTAPIVDKLKHQTKENQAESPVTETHMESRAPAASSQRTRSLPETSEHQEPQTQRSSPQPESETQESQTLMEHDDASSAHRSRTSTLSFDIEQFAAANENRMDRLSEYNLSPPPFTAKSSEPSGFAKSFTEAKRPGFGPRPPGFSTSSKTLPRIRPSSSTSESIYSDDTFMGIDPPKVRKGSFAHQQDTALKFTKYEPIKQVSTFMATLAIAAVGSQEHLSCAVNEMIQSITVKKGKLFCTLTDRKEVGPIFNFTEFFNNYVPAPALTINSEDFVSFGTFFNSCQSMQQWARQTSMVTVTGKYSSEVLLNLAASFGHVGIFLLVRFQIFEKECFLEEFLAKIQKVFQITVDARFFTRSNYQSDFKYAVTFLENYHVPGRTLTVLSTKMVDVHKLHHDILLTEKKITTNQRLNFITDNHCYQEIAVLLTEQLHFDRVSSNIEMKNYENLIYLTFYKKLNKCDITLGFSTNEMN